MGKTRRTGRSLAFHLTALAASALLALGARADLVVYDDALQNGFSSWGWAADLNWADTTQKHSGTSSFSFSSDSSWEGAYLHGAIDTNAYDAVLMWVRGSSAGMAYDVVLHGPAGNLGSAPLSNFLAGGAIPNGSWALATIPFSSLGVAAGTGVDGLIVQAEGTQPTVFLDDVSLRAVPVAPLTVAVHPGGTHVPVSPLIYGVAHFDEAGSSQLSYPARRWGGNATTRYNWEIDIQNRASDWFFENIPNGVANPALLPNGSTADLWIDSTKAHGGEPVLTLPMLGWVPKGSNPATDRVTTWGYSVAKYGPQQQSDGDAGNGCTASSPPGTCTWLAVTPDPTDTSKAVGPDYVTRWMDHIASRVGTSTSGGVKYLVLDNEPMLWNSTHHDVHPAAVSYDELWQKSAALAAAVKAKDPNVQVMGPALWGWCAYWSSASDGQCSGDAGTDYASHGNLHLTPWYLKQVADYRAAHGVRLVDWLDWHYYPQANGVFSSDESAATAALRLRSLKSLYDPSYVDESWISGVPVNVVMLIPRMRDWIAQYAPGTRIAINEYNFGDGTGASSALAQAEALAIFAREGVDMANRWVVPPANSLLEDAFRLYLNYDGAGAKVAGDSVPAASSNVDLVGAYAVRGNDKLFLLLFDKDTQDRAVTVTIDGNPTATASLYRLSGAMRLGSAGTAAVNAGSLALTLPARSATLAVVPYAAAGSRFYTLPPCRLLDTRNADGPLGGPALSAGVARTFELAGTCGVPIAARALSLNITVTQASASGDLRLHAAGTPAPVATSINFKAGGTRANNAIAGISDDRMGALTVEPDLASGTVHLIVDVNGFFE